MSHIVKCYLGGTVDITWNPHNRSKVGKTHSSELRRVIWEVEKILQGHHGSQSWNWWGARAAAAWGVAPASITGENGASDGDWENQTLGTSLKKAHRLRCPLAIWDQERPFILKTRLLKSSCLSIDSRKMWVPVCARPLMPGRHPDSPCFWRLSPSEDPALQPRFS